MIITTRHLFTIPGFSAHRGFCRDNSKVWARAHGIDWRAFVRNGIDESVLAATGDAFAQALIDWAHECASRAGND